MYSWQCLASTLLRKHLSWLLIIVTRWRRDSHIFTTTDQYLVALGLIDRAMPIAPRLTLYSPHEFEHISNLYTSLSNSSHGVSVPPCYHQMSNACSQTPLPLRPPVMTHNSVNITLSQTTYKTTTASQLPTFFSSAISVRAASSSCNMMKWAQIQSMGDKQDFNKCSSSWDQCQEFTFMATCSFCLLLLYAVTHPSTFSLSFARVYSICSREPCTYHITTCTSPIP